MFTGFEDRSVRAHDLDLRVRHGGSGPPVLLLHGHPRTSATWHRVAPLLVARGFTVVCPDLPGYGRSGRPAPEPGHEPHSKRASARRVLALMRALGHDRFAVAGHDRGSYVALRLALDHPAAVERLALLDCLPISEHLARADARFATAWWHWFFYAQPELPERVITADPDAWYRGDPATMGQENYEEWRAATHDPGVVRGMLEDYRAGLTVDRRDEEADRAAGRRVHAPLLVLWSTLDDLVDLHGDPLAIWRDWASDVRGHGVVSGHHMAEEAPDALADALAGFFGRPRRPPEDRSRARRAGQGHAGRMDELLMLHRVNADRVTRLVHRAGESGPEVWGHPTPCTEWSVHDLLNHLTAEQLWAPELLAGRSLTDVGGRFDGDVLGEDPVAAWDAAIAAALAAFAEEGALTRTVDLLAGQAPAHEYLDEMVTDLAVHGWDLARGIGVDDEIDPATVDRLLVEWSTRTGELAHGRMFAGPLAVPDDADEQTRLLALFGRRA